MKQIVVSLLLTIFSIMTTQAESNCCQSPECAGIRAALDLYVQAAIQGDSKIARPAFAETATISHVEGDTLISLPIQALFDYYDRTGPHGASYVIEECSVAGDVAIVRIESIFGSTEFSDMFTLAKDGENWKIISKVFHVKQ
ncbi:MAG: nuclear transport factor 2 family protein [Bacteroidales bacterium]|nr:nuclear transport factor 2 family protein [Bacteroidales bacterium]